MLDKYNCLKKLAGARRADDVVVTTMSVAMPWAALSDTHLDFAHVDSAMGHAYVTAGDEDAIVLWVCWKPG